jgi:hypothetical protein
MISGRLINGYRVIGVSFTPVVADRLGLQLCNIRNVVKGFPVLNTFRQVWMSDPVEADSNCADLARCHKHLTLFWENTGVEEQFGVLNVWPIALKNFVLDRTRHTWVGVREN